MKTMFSISLILTLVCSSGYGQAQSSDARNHLVRVVTISQEGLQNHKGNRLLSDTLARLNRAASFRPDIACLPETFSRFDPESVPGPTTERLSDWAKNHNCYVICPISVRDGEWVFNSAVLINRSGEIVGRYDKIRPTEGELKKSVCPGVDNPPVFKTDFGTIGIQICFDVNWNEQWRNLKQQGADIIFFPSAYPAARQVSALAWRHQCFVVSSTKTRRASLYDITGDQIATTGKYQYWAGAVLPIGKRLFEIDYHVSKMRRIAAEYGDKVRIDWFHDDDLVSLASLDPQLTVDDLISEFELTPHPAYIQRAQQAQDSARPDP